MGQAHPASPPSALLPPVPEVVELVVVVVVVVVELPPVPPVVLVATKPPDPLSAVPYVPFIAVVVLHAAIVAAVVKPEITTQVTFFMQSSLFLSSRSHDARRAPRVAQGAYSRSSPLDGRAMEQRPSHPRASV